MRSRGPPSASSTVRRDAPKPISARSLASAAGPSPSEVSARMRAPGCKCGRTRSSVRPCSDSSTVCGSGQPSRAAARLKADGAGTTIISRASMWRASTAPTPYWNGSPDASTQTCRPRWRRTSSAAPSNGLGHGRVAPRMSGAASARWRRPPNTISAAPIEPARHRAQTLDAILADADDGQPARRCGSVARDADRQAAY